MVDIYQGKPINLEKVEFPKVVKTGIYRPTERRFLQIQIAEPFYPIEIHRVDEPDQSYYLAYFVDFGASACSATGDTIEEALETLNKVKKDIINYLIEKNEDIPKPSVSSFDRKHESFISDAVNDIKGIKSPRRVYDKFCEIFMMLTVKDFIIYLTNEDNVWRSILLSCMSDYDYEINDSCLRWVLLGFVTGEDRDLARSAAMALNSSGGTSQVALCHIVNKYDLKDINSLLDLVNS